jgi:Xaa-Pro aminopeptidase
LDPFVHPASFAKDVEKAMVEVASSELDDEKVELSELITDNENLIDPIWGADRPDIPTSPFRIHDVKYAGKTVSEKFDKIRQEMEKKHATMAVFSTLDDVAYLLNLRATGDIDTCPVGIAYATLTSNQCILYCDSRKLVAEDVKSHLDEVGVVVKPYDDILKEIKQHVENVESKPKIWLDKSRSNLALASVIPEAFLLDSQNAITPMKAAKNKAEIDGMREAHIVDGAAMANFMTWLENEIVIEGRAVDEVEIDEVLTGFRAKQPGFVECSFPTIAGVGPNGAIIHYRAQRDSVMKYLDRQSPILLDSGGQYAYGTTDVTRTWSFQENPDPKFMEYYTRVLKGHIGVDQMVFPENTPGFVLDVFARRWLWNIGKDYGHGTGHGVGAALNVHEGPISISPRFTNTEGLKNGMVVSNEPGYYEDGNFGVRIENLLEIQYVNPEHDALEDGEGANGDEAKSTEKKFLKFGRLTQIPIQKSLINLDLMTSEELDWLDSYHDEVLRKVGPRLEDGSPALKWLTKSCEKIQRQR